MMSTLQLISVFIKCNTEEVFLDSNIFLKAPIMSFFKLDVILIQE